MENNLVKTVDGSMVNRAECRRISGKFYKIGDVNIKDSGHCYLINGRYYKYNTGYIIYDHREMKYVIKNELIIENGVVGLENDQLVFGAFNNNLGEKLTSVKDADGKTYVVLNPDIFQGSKVWLENIRNGDFYHRTVIKARDIIIPKVITEDYKRNFPYSATGEYMQQAIDKYKAHESDIKVQSMVSSNFHTFEGLSYGLEFETTKGMVPQRVLDKLGLMQVRDGSVNGMEYVTIPLSGKTGVQTIANITKELKRRTQYDSSCSLHLHIGGMPRTPEFITALTRVLLHIQDDMFKMFPEYKKGGLGVKRKAYTKPLPVRQLMDGMDRRITKDNLLNNFNEIYKYFSMGYNYGDHGKLDEIKSHPADPRGTSKWNIRTRYHWVNLIPLMFTNGKTVEFRLHTPTYDDNKVMNYVAICSAIIKYTMRNEETILSQNNLYNLSLLDVVASETGGRLRDNLFHYIESRMMHSRKHLLDGKFNYEEDEFNYVIELGAWNGTKVKNQRVPTIKKRRGGGLIDAIDQAVNPLR